MQQNDDNDYIEGLKQQRKDVLLQQNCIRYLICCYRNPPYERSFGEEGVARIVVVRKISVPALSY